MMCMFHHVDIITICYECCYVRWKSMGEKQEKKIAGNVTYLFRFLHDSVIVPLKSKSKHVHFKSILANMKTQSWLSSKEKQII